jgi:hypothetical protein
MPGRKQLRGVAEGTVTSFVSRNNDLDGYWAIGKLCRLVAPDGAGKLHVELLPATAPSRFADMASRSRERLRRHLESLGLPTSVVSAAQITLSFEADRTAPPHVASAASTHYRCCAMLVDDLGRECRAEASGWCWPHDPSRELRSARAD